MRLVRDAFYETRTWEVFLEELGSILYGEAEAEETKSGGHQAMEEKQESVVLSDVCPPKEGVGGGQRSRTSAAAEHGRAVRGPTANLFAASKLIALSREPTFSQWPEY